MAYITLGTTSQLQIVVPSKGSTDWSETMRTSTFNKIVTHDHSGASGKGVQLTATALAADSVTGLKILLANDQYLRGRNAANSADINIIKVNSSNTLTLGTTLASPTMTTPVLGVASATSVNKVAITAPATAATLTLADGSTLVTSGANSVTLTSTGATNVTLPTTGTLTTLAGSEALTNKTIDADLNTITNIENADIKAAAAIAVNKLAATTASRALASDGSGFITASATTATELGYLSGVTSAVQTQITDKISKTYLDAKGDLITASAADTPALLSVGSYGQVLTVDSSTSSGLKWAAVSGGINYVTNSDFEGNNVTGWVTYADAAASVPVDMTAGSPASTFAANSSSPLRGTYDAIWTKSAANRQGEGFSFAYTQDSGDKASVIKISFDYKTSAAYADNDMAVFVYDVTNSALIYVTPQNILANTTVGHYTGYFQSSASGTSYRVGIHTTSTNASAYTVQFDNIRLGPDAKTTGAAITDWTSFTPTSSTWVSNATFTGMMRRVGDMAEFTVNIALAGAPTTANLDINLPVTIDTTKMVGTVGGNTLGIGTADDVGTLNYPVVIKYLSTTSVTVHSFNASATYATSTRSTESIPFAFGNTDRVILRFSVPVVGWSSGVQVSSDADTRVVSARYASDASTNDGTAEYTIDYEDKIWDTHNAVTTGASWVFTAPVTGYYHVQASIGYASSAYSSGERLYLALYKNGSSNSVLHNMYQETASTRIMILGGATTVQLNAGDTIYLRGFNGRSGGTARQGVITSSWVAIDRISGPAQIAANELVAAKFENVAGTTVGALAVVPFVTVTFDSHSASSGTGTSWVYTVPASGKYQVDAAFLTQSATWAAGDQVTVFVYKNGANYARLSRKSIDAAITTTQGCNGGCLVDCVAGNTLTIVIVSTQSVALNTSAGNNFVCIHRVGF